MTLQSTTIIKNVTRRIVSLLLVLTLLLLSPEIAQAKVIVSQGENDATYSRSLESLRDLEYQTWKHK